MASPAPHSATGATELALRDRLAELVAINRVGIALSSAREMATVLDTGLREIVGGLGFERGLVLLLDEDDNVLRDGASFGAGRELGTIVANLVLRADDEESLLAQLVRADGPLLFRAVDTDPSEGNRRLAAALGVRDFVGTPLVSAGRTVGVLAVDDRRGGRSVQASDGPVLYTVGTILAGAIEAARLVETLEGQNRELEARVATRTTELVHAMAEAQDARAAAEHANEAKTAFLSNVSHELRTPLTSVVGFAKLIRRRLDETVFPAIGEGDPKVDRARRQVADNLGIIVAEGDRLTGLINDLLDLAKIEAGRFELRVAAADVGDIVRQGVAATSSLYEVAGLPLTTDIEEDLPEVSVDRDRLVQVVINLLSNAVKFTREGSVRVTVARRGDFVTVQVADTGPGIARTDRERVFEPFRQGSSDRLPGVQRGTGLGLPISRQIVEAHGGRMWLESEVGQGSTFAFALPVTPG